MRSHPHEAGDLDQTADKGLESYQSTHREYVTRFDRFDTDWYVCWHIRRLGLLATRISRLRAIEITFDPPDSKSPMRMPTHIRYPVSDRQQVSSGKGVKREWVAYRLRFGSLRLDNFRFNVLRFSSFRFGGLGSDCLLQWGRSILKDVV